MAILAHSDEDSLDARWRALPYPPEYVLLHQPEIGTIMVRARADGAGAPYSLAAMTVTRCAARVAGGGCGVAYVAGRNPRRAELAAVFDALLQDEDFRRQHSAGLLAPLAARIDALRRAIRRRAGASRLASSTRPRESARR